MKAPSREALRLPVSVLFNLHYVFNRFHAGHAACDLHRTVGVIAGRHEAAQLHASLKGFHADFA